MKDESELWFYSSFILHPSSLLLHGEDVMRWNRMWGLLTLLLAIVAGCKQRAILTEADNNYTTTTLVDHMDRDPQLSAQSLIPRSPAPPTLDDMDRKIRFISLAECI